MMDEFKDVVGYEGLYVVSNLGMVKSIPRLDASGHKLKGKILSIQRDRYGYAVVHLCKGGVRRYVKLHRIVAEAFIPNPNNLPEVNHKDENKLNNSVKNLEWCTTKYNQTYGTVVERRRTSNFGKHSKKEVEV